MRVGHFIAETFGFSSHVTTDLWEFDFVRGSGEQEGISPVLSAVISSIIVSRIRTQASERTAFKEEYLRSHRGSTIEYRLIISRPGQGRISRKLQASPTEVR